MKLTFLHKILFYCFQILFSALILIFTTHDFPNYLCFPKYTTNWKLLFYSRAWDHASLQESVHVCVLNIYVESRQMVQMKLLIFPGQE